MLARRFLLAVAASLGLPRVFAQPAAPARLPASSSTPGGPGAASPASSRPTIGSVDVVVDAATVVRDNRPATRLATGDRLMQGDLVQTGAASEAHIVFDDGGYLAVRPNSSVRIQRYVVTGESSDVAVLALLQGAMRSVTGWIGKIDHGQYRVTSATTTIGIRGTDHEVVLVRPQDSTPDMEAGVHTRVNEGAVVLRNAGRTVDVATGAAAYAGTGAAPRLRATVPAFFERLRSARDARVEAHARGITPHLEERLRRIGKLGPAERFEQFRERAQQRVRGGGTRAGGAGNAPARPTPEQRRAEIRAQREAQAHARREAAARRPGGTPEHRQLREAPARAPHRAEREHQPADRKRKPEHAPR